MPRLFIFNPETDYALAVGRSHYSLPQKIKKLRSDLQLVQAQVAHPGDAIVVDDDFTPASYPHPAHLELVKQKGLTLIRRSELRDSLTSEMIITPWGWNHTLLHDLHRAGLPNDYSVSLIVEKPWSLPTEEDIDRWRELSHRRTAIAFRKALPESEGLLLHPGCEFTDVADALEFADAHMEVYFKAPWSSSGRGVVTTSTFRPVNEGEQANKGHQANEAVFSEKLKEWLSGCIKSQGSVTAEIGVRRKADFASEWLITDGKAGFRGLSLFETTENGKYLSNHSLSYSEIAARLTALSPFWSDKILSAQKQALEEIIAPGYEGPVGIDMLISEEGLINPCVELNLRLTMGIMALGTNFYSL